VEDLKTVTQLLLPVDATLCVDVGIEQIEEEAEAVPLLQ
jgi:hypothetical protein